MSKDTYKEPVKFYLEKRRDKQTGEISETNVPINLFFSYGSGRFQYYTGFRTDAQRWDEKAMQVKGKSSEVSEINQNLKRLRVKVLDAFSNAKVLGVVMNPQHFRDAVRNNDPLRKARSKTKPFKECVEQFIESSKVTKTASTVGSIEHHFKRLELFSKATGTRLSFDNIDMEFYESFLKYCFEKCGYKNNYTGTLIKTLKAFLNWATEKGYNTNLEFRKKTFKKLMEETEIIFLTYDEVLRFYKHKFKNQQHSDVRDVFCFGCFTGMRYSDIAALSPENLHADKIIYRVVKTGQNNTIPLNPYTQALLKKHKGHPLQCLPVMDKQKTNELLKEAAKIAKLNRKVELIHFQGAKRIKQTKPLSEVITFHVSKKTFMTNFLARGGSLLTAMSITGNKDLKTARRYYKVVDELKETEMKKVFG
ncbi:MAG: tyrosine-type recombinase/integrase [Bacteroidota bacterium]